MSVVERQHAIDQLKQTATKKAAEKESYCGTKERT